MAAKDSKKSIGTKNLTLSDFKNKIRVILFNNKKTEKEKTMRLDLQFENEMKAIERARVKRGIMAIARLFGVCAVVIVCEIIFAYSVYGFLTTAY